MESIKLQAITDFELWAEGKTLPQGVDKIIRKIPAIIAAKDPIKALNLSFGRSRQADPQLFSDLHAWLLANRKAVQPLWLWVKWRDASKALAEDTKTKASTAFGYDRPVGRQKDDFTDAHDAWLFVLWLVNKGVLVPEAKNAAAMLFQVSARRIEQVGGCDYFSNTRNYTTDCTYVLAKHYGGDWRTKCLGV